MKYLLMSFSFLILSLKANAQYTCLDRLTENLGIHSEFYSNPKILESILKEDMMLFDQEDVAINILPKIATPILLDPMINTIKNAVLTKHAPVMNFVCIALAQGLIPQLSDEEKVYVVKTLNHTYLLEEITKLMRNDVNVMVRIRDFVLQKRAQLGMSNFVGIMRTSGDLFMSAKMTSMDIAMERFVRVRRANNFAWHEVLKTREGLRLNILEAISTDVSNSFNDNAIVGGALATEMPRRVYVDSDKRVLVYDITQRWMTMYETWNLSFITGNLTELQLLYPKLIMPSVINAQPRDYIFNRGLSLWLTSNFYLFAKIRGNDSSLPRGRELSELWGRLNRLYLGL